MSIVITLEGDRSCTVKKPSTVNHNNLIHVVFIRLREPGSWTQRLRKGVTKRCLALGIWHGRTYTSYIDSVKSTEEIGQSFLETEATYSLRPASSSGHVFNIGLLHIAESMQSTLRATPT